MLAHFQPADNSGRGGPTNGRHGLTVPFLQRPLSLVRVSDPAMKPELCLGQLAYVQNFEVYGANYLEQRMAVRVGDSLESISSGRPEGDSLAGNPPESDTSGRVLVRRVQMIPGGVRLFGNQGGYEETFIRPDEWDRPSDWKISGRLHPDLVALGPLVTTSRGGRTYIATAGWSN